MNQSEGSSNEFSVINQESKINGKLDTIEGQLSFMGEGDSEKPRTSPSKEESTFSLFPKKFDDNQDTQDGLRETDLPNGHNNPDAVDITPRTKSLDELLKESEELSDTELIGCTKEFVESSKMDTQSSENQNASDKVNAKKEENNTKDEIEKTEIRTPKDDKETSKKVEELQKEDKKDDNLESVTESESNTEKSENNNSSASDIKQEELKNKSFEVKKENKYEDKAETEEDSFKLEVSKSQLIHTSPPTDTEKEEDEFTKEKESDEKQKSKSKSKASTDNEQNDNSTEEENQVSDISEREDQMVSSDTPLEDCHCTPECHTRMKLLKKYLGNACKQLDGYIKLKKQEELSNFLKLMSEIELIAENKKNEISQGLLNDAFQEENGILKKRKTRPSKMSKADVSISKKEEVADKKNSKGGQQSKRDEPMSEINFKNLKGLAVFAKWPNSGWYYPGIIEGLTNSDWKEATNVKVKFYDGLVREMKNINILPAHLIPATSIVSDLDDETEMIVLSTNRVDNNSVEFLLSTREESGKNLEMNFNKLAIKALHMKSIKQQLEPNMNVTSKKMHMVSLDNLVSGRRSRIRTAKVEDEANTETTPRKYARKSTVPDPDKLSSLNSEESASTTTTPVKTYANKRGTTPKRTPSKRMKN